MSANQLPEELSKPILEAIEKAATWVQAQSGSPFLTLSATCYMIRGMGQSEIRVDAVPGLQGSGSVKPDLGRAPRPVATKAPAQVAEEWVVKAMEAARRKRDGEKKDA